VDRAVCGDFWLADKKLQSLLNRAMEDFVKNFTNSSCAAIAMQITMPSDPFGMFVFSS
jgi:hypothetical protein